jgi:CIC family chloride channel protein
VSAPATPIQRLWLRENQLFLALTILIGVLAGLCAVLFTVAIAQVTRRLFGISPSGARLLSIPPLVGLATGVLLTRVFPDVAGSGVPQTEAAYHLAQGVIPGRVPLGKFLTGILCIGSGHSMGREGPSVQIGAGLASVIGRWFRLSPARVRDLVPVGAAGALAAAFNTPVAAVLFALEEIIGDMNAALLGSTVVASVAAVIVERSILGNEPLFHVPVYHLMSPAELAAYAVLGVIGGGVSLLFAKGLLGLRVLFLRMPRSTRILQPALGGLAIGGLLLVSPAIMGVGYEFVDQALNGTMLLKTMAVLCALKLAGTIISYASGNAGGIFAPSLYIGAMAGGTVGTLVHMYAPFPTADPGAYALVGMGTLFAGIIRAPMTSVFMIFEITQDYQILVPLMLANMLSYTISKRYQPVPVYHALLHQDGVHLPASGYAGRRATARPLMRNVFTFIPPGSSVEGAAQMALEHDAPAYLVGTRERLEGIATREALADAVAAGRGGDSVMTVVDAAPPHAHPDQPLDVVLERFAESPGLLPIVSRADARQAVAVVTVDSILEFLNRRTAGAIRVNSVENVARQSLADAARVAGELSRPQ